MHRLVLSIPTLCVFVLLPATTYPQAKRDIPLPKDKSAAVVTLDFRGGYGPPRKDSLPPQMIFADARVRVIDTNGDLSPLESKMSAEELQDLLQFAIDDHKFFNFDPAMAMREVSAESKRKDLPSQVSMRSKRSLRSERLNRSTKRDSTHCLLTHGRIPRQNFCATWRP